MITSRVGILTFPGSNCDSDCLKVFRKHFGIELQTIWYADRKLPKFDGLIIPGGFSFGDYLRGGALASRLPIMAEVKKHAEEGRAILGICNGFQILTEAGLLPGTLLRNETGKFICRLVELKVPTGASLYQNVLVNRKLRLPIAHGEGRYYASASELQRLTEEGQILCRYINGNPNGSSDAIAGVLSKNKRIVGMMPHPERATEDAMGCGADGLKILEAFLASFL